jgi:hypothetical protein
VSSLDFVTPLSFQAFESRASNAPHLTTVDVKHDVIILSVVLR